MRVEILGVYPVDEAREPCHLVELVIHGYGQLQVGEITQETAGRPRANWQVAYDEHFVDADRGDGVPIDIGVPLQLNGSTRIAFFFHYLALDRPLLTPCGLIPLPEPLPRPSRLSFLRYDPP